MQCSETRLGLSELSARRHEYNGLVNRNVHRVEREKEDLGKERGLKEPLYTHYIFILRERGSGPLVRERPRSIATHSLYVYTNASFSYIFTFICPILVSK